MLRIQCRCGETFHADDRHLGRRLRCRCGRTVAVRVPARDRVAALRTRATGWLQRLPRQWSAGRPRQPRRAAVERTGLHRQFAWLETGLGWTAWTYLALAALAWLVLWRFADRWWPATALLFGPRWLLLLPLALLVPAALLLRRSLLLPLGAAALIVLIPVMGLRVGRAGLPGGQRTADDLRVVTLNADARPGAILRLQTHLEHWEPDVVAIQECGNALEVLAGFLADWHSRADGPLCLLSRFPITAAESIQWDDLERVRESGIGGTSMAVRYTLQAPQRELHLVNLHLETPRKGLESLRYQFDALPVTENMTMREIESRRAFGWLGADRDPLIVAGDFNMPVESGIYRESWGSFENAFSRAGRGFGMTKDNGWIRVRIDHILAGRHWRARRAFVGPDVGSDHRPVVADLRWVGETQEVRSQESEARRTAAPR